MRRLWPIEHAWVNSSKAPIYEVTFPRSATIAELREYFRAVETWAARATYKVIWVINGLDVREFAALQRSEFAAFLRRMHDFDRHCTHATALVITNSFVRGVVTAVFWLHRPPYLHHVFSSIAEARAWATERAREV